MRQEQRCDYCNKRFVETYPNEIPGPAGTTTTYCDKVSCREDAIADAPAYFDAEDAP